MEENAEASAEKSWYIVQTQANLEKRVTEVLRERAKHLHLGHLFEEIVVPSEKVVELKRGRKTLGERKLFPGYVLIRMEMTDDSYHFVRDTPGVLTFLGAEHNKKPQPLPQSDVDRMLNQAKGGNSRTVKPSVIFEVGEQVRVCDGPFASFHGVVDEVDEIKTRLKVAVYIFGRSTPVDLDYTQVEKFN